MSLQSYLGGLLSAALIMASCGGALAQDKKQITIGLASGSLPAGMVRYANEMGLFAKYGLEASIVPMDSASVATAALISGAIEFTVGSTNEVVIAKARGQDLIGVESLYTGGLTGVVVLDKAVADKLNLPEDAPVEAKLKALDGLIIATPDAKSSFTFVLKPAAESQGAAPRYTYLAQTAMTAALESGAVQGYIASSPAWAQSVKSGKGVVWISGPKGDFPTEFLPGNPTALSTSLNYARENPDVIKNIRAALADFNQAVRERPQEVKAVIQKIYPALQPDMLDLIYETEAMGFQSQPVTAESMDREIAFVKKNGVNLPGMDQMKGQDLIYVEGQ